MRQDPVQLAPYPRVSFFKSSKFVTNQYPRQMFECPSLDNYLDNTGLASLTPEVSRFSGLIRMFVGFHGICWFYHRILTRHLGDPDGISAKSIVETWDQRRRVWNLESSADDIDIATLVQILV